MTKRVPTNTTEETKGSAGLLFLAEQMATGRAIENQEERGQRELVNSDVLPADGSKDPAWEKMGVKYGEQVEGDKIFRHVELPAGWKKVSTDHAMWNSLVDEKGRVRARFFYKAAFYDRSAHISPVRRFEATYEPEGGFGGDYNPDRRCFAVVKDAGTEIYLYPAPFDAETSEQAKARSEKAHADGGDYGDDHSTYPKTASEMARRAALAWLKEKYPDADDPCAYWD